jgi:hypothetical protein
MAANSTISSGAPVDIKTFDTAGGTWTKPAGIEAASSSSLSAPVPAGLRPPRRRWLCPLRRRGRRGRQRLFCELPAGEVPNTLTVAVGTGGAGGLVVSADARTATPARPAPPRR